jgi:hypothetical protein
MVEKLLALRLEKVKMLNANKIKIFLFFIDCQVFVG